MPEHTEKRTVDRCENMLLYTPYASYKQGVLSDLPDWSTEQVESWLFHGTDSVDEVLRSGFKSSCVNLSAKGHASGRPNSNFLHQDPASLPNPSSKV